MCLYVKKNIKQVFLQMLFTKSNISHIYKNNHMHLKLVNFMLNFFLFPHTMNH